MRYISHELRTPLNTAFLGLKLLTDELKISGNPVDEARCETLGDVNLSCKAALDILNDLLCFDKLESGILDLHKQELYILPFVHNCVAMFKVQAKEIGVGMVVVNPSIEVTDSDYRKKSHYHRIKHSETILMDKFKMDQVVRNLISNALKFTPRGGTVTITVTYEPIQSIKKDMNHLAFHKVFSKMKPITDRLISTSSMFSMASSNQIFNDLDLETGRNAVDDNFVSVGYLVISVRDTGAGISEVNQKRLFNDIVQFNPEILQAGGGSGLGLWITKGIVDLHEGEISVHSDGEGCGSVFTCKIPMWRNDEDFGDIVESPCRDLHSAFSSVDGGLDRNLSKSCSFDILPLDLPINLLTMKAAAACKVALESIALSRQGSRRGSAAPKLKPLVHGPHYNLLIVDDSRLNRKMLCKMLRGAGHICDEAEDGLMAVEKVKESMLSAVNETVVAYDAILMDFVMPNMGGPEATKIICGMGFMGPIYGVTGNALEGDIQHFTDCGATQVFTKPLDFGYLQQCMKDALTVVESDTEAEIE